MHARIFALNLEIQPKQGKKQEKSSVYPQVAVNRQIQPINEE